MIVTNPKKIPGRWRDGYALDYHTLSSEFVGYDEFGHARFDTKRSEVGELLYRLKYRSDQTAVADLVDAAVSFLRRWAPSIDIVVPVPPSRQRPYSRFSFLEKRLRTELACSS
jgi:competence protein ComFC